MNGVTACNKEGAKLRLAGIQVPFVSFKECEVFKIENLGAFYLDAMAGVPSRGTLYIRDDFMLDGKPVSLLDRLSWIDPDILSGNKRAVNLSLELMGARTMQRLAAEVDARLHASPSTARLREVIKESGIRQAVKQRDERFGDGRIRLRRRGDRK